MSRHLPSSPAFYIPSIAALTNSSFRIHWGVIVRRAGARMSQQIFPRNFSLSTKARISSITLGRAFKSSSLSLSLSRLFPGTPPASPHEHPTGSDSSRALLSHNLQFHHFIPIAAHRCAAEGMCAARINSFRRSLAREAATFLLCYTRLMPVPATFFSLSRSEAFFPRFIRFL